MDRIFENLSYTDVAVRINSHKCVSADFILIVNFFQIIGNLKSVFFSIFDGRIF